jgi:hypothetical protein
MEFVSVRGIGHPDAIYAVVNQVIFRGGKGGEYNCEKRNQEKGANRGNRGFGDGIDNTWSRSVGCQKWKADLELDILEKGFQPGTGLRRHRVGQIRQASN